MSTSTSTLREKHIIKRPSKSDGQFYFDCQYFEQEIITPGRVERYKDEQQKSSVITESLQDMSDKGYFFVKGKNDLTKENATESRARMSSRYRSALLKQKRQEQPLTASTTSQQRQQPPVLAVANAIPTSTGEDKENGSAQGIDFDSLKGFQKTPRFRFGCHPVLGCHPVRSVGGLLGGAPALAFGAAPNQFEDAEETQEEDDEKIGHDDIKDACNDERNDDQFEDADETQEEDDEKIGHDDIKDACNDESNDDESNDDESNDDGGCFIDNYSPASPPAPGVGQITKLEEEKEENKPPAFEAENSKLQLENDSLKEQLSVSKENDSSLQQENDSLKGQLSLLKAADSAWQQENDSLKEQLSLLKAVDSARQQENDSLKEQLSLLKAADSARQQENDSLTEQVSDLKQRLSASGDLNSKLQQEKGDLEEQVEVLKNGIERNDDTAAATDDAPYEERDNDDVRVDVNDDIAAATDDAPYEERDNDLLQFQEEQDRQPGVLERITTEVRNGGEVAGTAWEFDVPEAWFLDSLGLSAKQFENALKPVNNVVSVAYLDNEICSIFVYQKVTRRRKVEFHVQLVWTNSMYRRKGLCSKVMSVGINDLSDDDTLQSHDNRADAKALFKGQGWISATRAGDSFTIDVATLKRKLQVLQSRR